MRCQARWGACLAANPGLEPLVAEAIRHHHERWDGLGYPDGSKGENIPLLARILAVVEAYDAVTMSRPDRPRMSVEQAFDERRRCTGSQFDPVLARVLERVVSGRGGSALARRESHHV